MAVEMVKRLQDLFIHKGFCDYLNYIYLTILFINVSISEITTSTAGFYVNLP